MSALNKDFPPMVTSVISTTEIHNIPVSGNYSIYAVGDFGGGTLSLDISPNNGADWFTVNQLTVAGRLIQWLSSGEKLRFSLDGATSPNVSTGIRQ